MESLSDDVLIAVTRPVRGREMIPTTVPTDMFGAMRLELAKTANRDEDNVETFYEGYVDGKKYLVPDSNLEAMKDVVNLGMRQRRSIRFRHQTSSDVQDEVTLERIDKMLAKVRELTLSLSVEESGSVTKLGETNTKEVSTSKSKSLSRSSSAMLKADSESKSESQKISSQLEDGILKSKSLSRSYTSMSKANSESRSGSQKISPLREDGISLSELLLLATEESVLSEYKSKEQQPEVDKEDEESDDSYIRLILSGHFKNDEKPIYIIQEYNTKSPLFSKQSADFTSSQTQGNVHIFMAGKLFNEKILEETDGKPTSLNLKPNKIIIDENKCKIFRSYFENTYTRNTTDITMKGEFLLNEESMDITPFLALAIKHNHMNTLNYMNNEQESEEKRPSILVKNRQSLRSSTYLSKENKRVSFKESSDDEELYVIYKNIKKNKPDNSLNTQAACAEKEGHLQNRQNENHRSGEQKQIIAKKKILERIFYLVTANSFFKKIFTKRK